MRRCKWCGEIKPLDAFRTSRNGKDGRRAECRSCSSGYDKQRREQINAGLKPLKLLEDKMCPRCGVVKEMAQFPKDRNSITGHGGWCHECNRKNSHQWRDKNRERYNAEISEKYHSDPERRIRQRALNLRYHYGITLEQFEDMLDEQEGRCAICTEFPASGRKLHVDHDHTTGMIRALLCDRCNIGIGSFGEDVERILKVIAYLEKWAAVDPKTRPRARRNYGKDGNHVFAEETA